MNAADRARLDRLDQRLEAIERHQQKDLELMRSLLGLFEALTADRFGPPPPRPRERHLHIVE